MKEKKKKKENDLVPLNFEYPDWLIKASSKQKYFSKQLKVEH